MSLSSLNIVKKEETETESAAPQGVDANENVETSPEQAQNKGEHGKDFCCGSCS